MPGNGIAVARANGWEQQIKFVSRKSERESVKIESAASEELKFSYTKHIFDKHDESAHKIHNKYIG